MIKVNFKSNQDYGADELNNIVKYLRTDGIYGEITDCLKVTKGTGTTVNIADGIGWVGGCGIEVVEGATVTLPTTSGTYYIYMKVETQSDHTVDATITYTTTTQPANANCILASVVVASSTISTVTDERVNSTFAGTYQFAPTYNSGTVTLTGTISAVNATVVKSFSVPVGTKKAKVYMSDGSLLFEVGEGVNVMSGPYYDTNSSFHRSTELKTSFYSISGGVRGIGAFAASADGSVLIDNVVLQSLSNEVQITFKARVAPAQIDCKIDWEAW